MKKTKTSPAFTSEAELCADFISHIRERYRNNSYSGSWVCYPETAGWDILLVRKEDGVQIGIEAKLSLNEKVVSQALDGLSAWEQGRTGPDFRAILVPKTRENSVFPFFCDLLGVKIIPWVEKANLSLPGRFAKWQGSGHDHWWGDATWTPWLPDHRHKLPDYVPDVAAGTAAPIQLSHWKITAIKIQCILEERPVRRADFMALKISMSRWTQFWLKKTPLGWVRGEAMPDFGAQHPTIYEQIKADRDKWMPKDEATAFAPEKQEG